MVNFRFHVVSIIAIFLALAIGTVLGSAFVGRGVIDRLQSQIDRVSKRADDTEQRNETLGRDNSALSRYSQQTADYAVGRSLAGVRVDVVAERGIDGAAVDAQAKLLRQAGATVPGVVWLEPSWALDTPETRAAMREATGLTNRAATPLRTNAAGALGRRLASAPPLTDDLLTSLVDAKFVTLAGADGSPAPTAQEIAGDVARTLVLGGPTSPVPLDVVPALGGGLVDGKAKTAIGEVFAATDSVTDRSQWIDPIAGDDTINGSVSTIDDAERVEGQVAGTLALAELGTGGHGNYGLGRENTVPLNVNTTPGVR
jgi:hypothetical protein